MSQTADKVTPIDGTPKGELAKGMQEDAPAKEQEGDSIFDQELLDLIAKSEKGLQKIDDKRAELNAEKAHITAKLVDKGLNKDALKAAFKYFRTPEEKREGFDLTYQFARQALGCPIQDDLFVAAVQRQVDQHQAGKH